MILYYGNIIIVERIKLLIMFDYIYYLFIYLYLLIFIYLFIGQNVKFENCLHSLTIDFDVYNNGCKKMYINIVHCLQAC